jgi:beta-glucosidase
MGLSPRLEGEEMDVSIEGFEGGDRTNIDLPAVQKELIRRISSLNRSVTLVLMNGSALAINEENENIPAIVEAWYGGEAAGTAIADVLFGDYNPAGRLPVSFYKSLDDLPDFKNYDMDNRTYRYFEGQLLYPFGYGLSYSWFDYSNLSSELSEVSGSQDINISVDIENLSDRDGEEVAQVYVSYPKSNIKRPLRELKAFKRMMIKAGERKTIDFRINPEKDLAYYNEESGNYELEEGTYTFLVGPSSDRTVLDSLQIDIKN